MQRVEVGALAMALASPGLAADPAFGDRPAQLAFDRPLALRRPLRLLAPSCWDCAGDGVGALLRRRASGRPSASPRPWSGGRRRRAASPSRNGPGAGACRPRPATGSGSRWCRAARRGRRWPGVRPSRHGPGAGGNHLRRPAVDDPVPGAGRRGLEGERAPSTGSNPIGFISQRAIIAPVVRACQIASGAWGNTSSTTMSWVTGLRVAPHGPAPSP